jgi:type II restriction enzyme
MLKSRQISTEEFLKEFFETLTPGVIPREQFLDWAKINSKYDEYKEAIEYFDGLQKSSRNEIVKDLRDTLLSADDPLTILKGAFELLGHTGDVYVSDKDNLSIRSAAHEIAAGKQKEKSAQYCATLVGDLGIKNVTDRPDLGSVFFGVQVGLESNRRKNIGGIAFGVWTRKILESTVGLLGPRYSLEFEVKVPYEGDKNGKSVDFAILYDGKVRIGVEVNFYTTSGSKPSEIKRAYETVNRALSKVGVELVWITDGAGYLKMKKSLAEAFEAHPNTYNYSMASRYLKDDILNLLAERTRR